jgi:hypothetical protein
MKEMVKKTLECREVQLFCDIHGHSRQKNLFVYGCAQINGFGSSSLSGANKGIDKRGSALSGNGSSSGQFNHKEKALAYLFT